MPSQELCDRMRVALDELVDANTTVCDLYAREREGCEVRVELAAAREAADVAAERVDEIRRMMQAERQAGG